jgi:hypothetical protein
MNRSLNRFITRSAVVLALVLAIAVASLIGGASRAWAACSNEQLIPNVAEILVSQGAAGYTRLTRGKETIVRVYLTNPACGPSSKQAITPKSATLTVDNGDGTPTTLSNYQPLSGKVLGTQQVYSTADPFFVVPASELAPATNTGQFTVNFTFALTYTRTGSTANQTAITGSNTASAVVNQRTQAMRILVVPMGDRSSGSVQWSTTAEQELERVMADTARAFPVPTGAESQLQGFTPTTAGIRYRISGDLLDVKALGLYNGTKFCANAGNWATSQVSTGTFAGKTLKGELQERLDNYNQYNTPPADVVLGVIDGAIAWKSADGISGGCDDGRAATPDPVSKNPAEVAWVRVDTPGTYPTPLQMEVMHTLGIRSSLSFHGNEVEADGGTNKGYNVALRKVIALTPAGTLGFNDHSIMNYNTTTIPYRRDNTLAHPTDWMHGLCDLGGGGTCTISSVIGTDAGVAAGEDLDMFEIVGHLDGEPPSVKIDDAGVGAGDDENAIEHGIGDAGSPIHLLLCDGPCSNSLNLRRDIPLALSSQAPVDDDHVAPGPAPAPNTFSALVSLKHPTIPALTFSCAQLLHNGNPVPGVSPCAGDAPPDVVSTSSSTKPGAVLASFVPSFPPGEGQEFPTPLCCNGRAVAFDGTHLYVTVRSQASVYKVTTNGVIVGTVPIGTTLGALAYNAATGHFYGGDYDGNEKVYDVDYNAATKTDLFTFGDDPPEPCDGQGSTNFIDGLEYYLSGSEGRLALSGDICDTVFLKKLDGTAASPPSFATNNNSGITTDGASGFWLARLNLPVGTTWLTHVAGDGTVLSEFQISGYEAEDLAYDNVTFAPACAVWMNQATFGSPEVRAVAVPCGSGGGDAVVVKTTDTDFVTLFAVCGTQADATNPEVEKFSLGTYVPGPNGQTIVPITDDRYCVDATVIAEASNSWTTTRLNDAQADAETGAPSQSPTVYISHPRHLDRFRRGETIHFQGGAFDAEDGEIVGTLEWSDNTVATPIATGTKSFDYTVPNDAPTGDHIITLKATDSPPDSHTSQTTITINIRPAACPTAKCP